MSPEAQKPENSGESGKPVVDRVGRANRQFERLMMAGGGSYFRVDAPRPDQKGSYDEREQAQFRREKEQGKVHPTEGKLICVITYKLDERKIIYDYSDGTRIEDGPNGRIETPPPQSK